MHMKIFTSFLWAWCFLPSQVSSEDGGDGGITEQASDCPEVWIDFCSREANRYCYINDEEMQKCGTCLPGFFEFKARCIDEDKLDILQFFQEYAPEYLDPRSMEERLELYIDAVRFIMAHNNQNPPPPYELGLNKWSADSLEDTQQRLGFQSDLAVDRTQDNLNPTPPMVQSGGAPLSKIDWVEEKAVTMVKDQGRCGCCWAVAAAGAIEGAVAVNTGYLQSLSFQQWISCDDNNLGCNGGNLVYAMGYALQNNFGGIARESSYGYSDYQGTSSDECAVSGKPLSVAVKEASYVVDFYDDFPFQERMDRMKAAVSVQPAAIVIKTACKLFTNYKSGVLTVDEDCACNDAFCVDHAVLLVGYDDTHDPPYWKIKNSWSTGWGEDGYVRIAQIEKGQYGLFGILVHGVVPDLAYNVTEQIVEVSDDPSSGGDASDLEWWVWLLIILGIVSCGCFCCACIFGGKK